MPSPPPPRRRAGAPRPPRDDVDVLPGVVERHAGVEHRIDDPVELRRAGRRQEPVERPAEGDEADAVLLAEVPRRERRGGAERVVQRARAGLAELGERVEEDDDVRVPLGVVLVHPQLPATRARAPVDAADAIAGDERPQVGELDSLPLLPRDVVAAEDLRVVRAEQRPDQLLARVDLERRAPVELLLPPDEREGVASAEEDAAERVPAPAVAAHAEPQLATPAG